MGDLIDDLVVRTDRLIMSLPSSEQGSNTPISPIRLAWSAALRTCRGIIIDASIEYVAFFQNLIPLYIWFPESGEAVNMFTSPSQANSDQIKMF
jgi:hypothetical protein